MSNEEFSDKCQELKVMSQNIRAQLSKTVEDLDNIAQAQPANLPSRRYQPEDRIIPVRQPGRPSSTREAIPFLNVPGPGETWQQLNEWRTSYGLSPVTVPA